MLKKCEQCGLERDIQKGRKFCSRVCMGLAQRGRKNPHSAEWEAKRLAAVRKSGINRRGVKTGPRPPHVIEKMRAGQAAWRRANPALVRAMALDHLPKDVRMEKNGNWRGGRTKMARDFYTRNSGRIAAWRKAVFARDGNKCKGCGSTERLECHHILPLVMTTAFAFDRANGVTLCHDCHTKTDSYSTKGRDHTYRLAGKAIVILTIPHAWQDYDTAGNWRIGPDGSVLILVSETGDRDYEFLIALHELIEVKLCQMAGITEAEVDAFDMAFTGEGEPGDSPDAPYVKQHRCAMIVEHTMALLMGKYDHGEIG